MGKIKYLIRALGTLLGVYRNDATSLRLTKAFTRFIGFKYRFTWTEQSWWQDEEFNEWLERFSEDEGFNTHRRWFIYQACRLTSKVPGDTVECGVYKGLGSFIILKHNLKNPEKEHFVFDSFDGVSSPGKFDGFHWKRGDLLSTENVTHENLAQSGNLKFEMYKGWIPNEFHHVNKRRFSFVHIDVDLYMPTIDSMDFFYSRMNVGGVILCDDYGSTLCPGATKACDEFLLDKPEKMIALPDGGGFIIKEASVPLYIDPEA